mmetsp:Transcript_34966/g.79728  ORF Transcript_34966/g.79728 Transcript_34966/m.79728 type:complete len:283 (+) Transcript_34966:1356-2204(+)
MSCPRMLVRTRPSSRFIRWPAGTLAIFTLALRIESVVQISTSRDPCNRSTASRWAVICRLAHPTIPSPQRHMPNGDTLWMAWFAPSRRWGEAAGLSRLRNCLTATWPGKQGCGERKSLRCPYTLGPCSRSTMQSCDAFPMTCSSHSTMGTTCFPLPSLCLCLLFRSSLAARSSQKAWHCTEGSAAIRTSPRTSIFPITTACGGTLSGGFRPQQQAKKWLCSTRAPTRAGRKLPSWLSTPTRWTRALTSRSFPSTQGKRNTFGPRAHLSSQVALTRLIPVWQL